MENEVTEQFKDMKDGCRFFVDYKYADFDFVVEVYRDLLVFSIVKEYK